MAKFRSTYSSGGKQISTANQVIDFYANDYPYNNTNVQFLHFQTFTQAVRIKLNDENTVHWVDSNSEFIVSDIQIDKFTILDAGVEYYYTALAGE
jgi:hypothetical protein